MEKNKDIVEVLCIWQKENIMSDRSKYLDSLRGLAIILVVIGHIIQYNYEEGLTNPIFNIIYSFHMPLFFFLCGCTRCLYERTRGGMLENVLGVVKEISRKFTSLIIPSIAWTIVVPLFFKKDMHSFSGFVSGYWFLNVLFVIYALWFILSLLLNRFKSKWIVVAALVGGIVLCYTFNVYRIPLTYFCIFILGYIWQYYSLSNRIPSFAIFSISVVFLLLVGRYQYGDTFAGDPNRVWMLLPLSCIASIVLHWIFSNGEFDNKFMSELGRYSLGIYLTHFYLVRIPYLNYIQDKFTNLQQFILLLLIAMIISYVCVIIQKFVSRIHWFNGVLYGNWKFLKRQ